MRMEQGILVADSWQEFEGWDVLSCEPMNGGYQVFVMRSTPPRSAEFRVVHTSEGVGQLILQDMSCRNLGHIKE